jgi:hypothetical protein
MKGLQFFGNRVEDAANAFIDVLKYSDQSVDYPDFKDIEPWPDEIINMFYVIWKNAKFYDDVNYFLEKLIADEEHHIKLLKEAMGMDKATKGVTVIIK